MTGEEAQGTWTPQGSLSADLRKGVRLPEAEGHCAQGEGTFTEAAQARDGKTAPGDPRGKQRSILGEPSKMTKLPVFLPSLGPLA